MSIIGGAALTPLMGRLADVAGVAIAYAVPAACFVGVALYGWLGSEPDAEEVMADPGVARG
jgi:FHS family L-fucose permease-like MFS transporter